MAVQTVQEPPGEEKKKAKEKAMVDSTVSGGAFLGEEQAQDPGTEVRRRLSLVVERKTRQERLFKR